MDPVFLLHQEVLLFLGYLVLLCLPVDQMAQVDPFLPLIRAYQEVQAILFLQGIQAIQMVQVDQVFLVGQEDQVVLLSQTPQVFLNLLEYQEVLVGQVLLEVLALQ